jgi:hypothetical protein
MRINDASGVLIPAGFPHRCAPERLGRTPTARTLEDKVQARASPLPLPFPEIPLAEHAHVLDVRVLTMQAASVLAFRKFTDRSWN